MWNVFTKATQGQVPEQGAAALVFPGSCLPTSALGSTVCCSSTFSSPAIVHVPASPCLCPWPEIRHGVPGGTSLPPPRGCCRCSRLLLLLCFQNYFLPIVLSPLSWESLLPAEVLVITSTLRPDGLIPFQSKIKQVTYLKWLLSYISI